MLLHQRAVSLIAAPPPALGKLRSSPWTDHTPEMDQVAEPATGLSVRLGAVRGHVERSLSYESLAAGRHVRQVVADNKHLHHRPVWIEQRLQATAPQSDLGANF